MEQSCTQAKQDVKQVQVTGEALSHIATRVSEIDQMASEIAKSTAEQDNVAKEISSNIGRISTISEQNLTAAQHTLTTGNKLSEQAKKSQESMKNFKL